MTEDFTEFSNDYEIRQIAVKIDEAFSNETLSKYELADQVGELLLEYQRITGISDEELKEEVHGICNITEEQILAAFAKYNSEK